MSPSPAIDTLGSAGLLRTKSLQRQDVTDFEGSKLWGSKRQLVLILLFFGNFYLFMLRANLSIAIVEMTSEKNITLEGKTIVQEPEFPWDSRTKGWVLSVFSYGYCFAAVGGYLSIKYGGATVNGLGILFTAILTALSPWALRTNLYLFIVGRIAEGVFESFAYASTCDIWSKWTPKRELPTAVSIIHSGYMVGAAVTYPICGYIAEYWGWPMIFYFSGSFALVWCILFFKLVRNDPSQDEKISAAELRYLKQNISAELGDRKLTYPWKKVFTSKAVWSLCMNKIAYGWAQMAFLYCFPLYVKDITQKQTGEVGVVSSIPNVVNFIVTPIIGVVIAYLQNNLGYDPSKLQKRILIGGFSLAGVLFGIVGFSNFVISMICFVFIAIVLTINITILQLVAVGIAPNHAGLVAGISAFWFSVSAIIAPLSIGYIVVNHTRQEWGICFVLSGCIMLFAAVITAFFGSSEDQKWTLVDKNEDFENVALDKKH